MDFSRLTGFEWNEGNLKKILKRMEASTAEMAFQGEPWVALSKKLLGSEKRWFLINKVTEKYIFIVFTVRKNKIRIISARYMHQKEVKYYGEKIQQENHGK